jgi:hypothetical protein
MRHAGSSHRLRKIEWTALCFVLRLAEENMKSDQGRFLVGCPAIRTWKARSRFFLKEGDKGPTGVDLFRHFQRAF